MFSALGLFIYGFVVCFPVSGVIPQQMNYNNFRDCLDCGRFYWYYVLLKGNQKYRASPQDWCSKTESTGPATRDQPFDPVDIYSKQ